MRRKNNLAVLLILVILFSSFQLGFAADVDTLTQYNMDIKLNTKDNTVEANQNISFVNKYDSDLKEIVFHLYPDAYNSYETMPAIGGMYFMEGEDFPEIREEEKGYIKIQDVHIDKNKAKYTAKDQILKIELKKPLKKGEKVDINIKFTLKIPEGNHRFHQMGGTYSLTNWYPILSIYDEKSNTWDENSFNPIGESNYSDVSNYNVKLTLPKKLVVAPTGTILGEEIDGEDKIVTIKAEKVRDFVILMSHTYKIKTRTVDGIKISHYYMEYEDSPRDKSVNKVLDEVVKVVKFMNKTFGKYPYKELRIAETFLGGGAMEYPQVIQMGRYEDLSKVNINERAPFTIEAAVHEAIHQWWYVGVGNDEFNEPFLDESLTVFTTALYFEKQYDKYHENGVAYSIRNRIYPSNILPLNSSVDKFNNWGDYGETIYTRGPAFFEDLRERVGEEKLIKILRTYYNKYLFKNATIEGLLKIIDEIAGSEIKEIMEKSIKGPNYFPQNIELTEEERANYYKNQEIRSLKMAEERNGLIIPSIILRALEGDEVVLVKPSYLKEEDEMQIDNFIEMLTNHSRMDFGLDIKVIDENKITEGQKEGNLILIGYPKKDKIMKEMAPKLPININSSTLSIKGVYIKNENITGSFIAENPNNKKNLVLVIFLDENKVTEKIEEQGMEYIMYDDTLYRYNPIYQRDVQFIINTKDIEIRGMYK